MGRKVSAALHPADTPMEKGAALPVMSGAISKGREDALLAEARELLKDHEPFTPGWEYHMGTILALSIRKKIPVQEW